MDKTKKQIKEFIQNIDIDDSEVLQYVLKTLATEINFNAQTWHEESKTEDSEGIHIQIGNWATTYYKSARHINKAIDELDNIFLG